MEKHYRVNEVAELSGLAVATIRKRLRQRKIGYKKSERAVLIPEREVWKLLGEYQSPVATTETRRS
ncbi:MAG: hypothetical protein ACRDGM_07760 [bacterium]